jgi:hypothetical protein
MTTYSDHEQRMLDQRFSADMDRRAAALARIEAHSRLVAAAPALLAALEGLAALDRTPDRFASPELLAARAAISKAKGQ